MTPERLVVIEKRKPELLQRAISAIAEGKSWRGFQVGAAALVEDDFGNVEIFHGSNIKLEKDGPKTCAEQMAIQKAQAAGFNNFLAIAVAGEPQLDEESGRFPLTLHPCDGCRDLLLAHPGIKYTTIVITTHPANGVTEEHELKDLLAMHS